MGGGGGSERSGGRGCESSRTKRAENEKLRETAARDSRTRQRNETAERDSRHTHLGALRTEKRLPALADMLERSLSRLGDLVERLE